MIAPTVQIDELDQQLIEILSRDARVSNRKIAADLGVTEGTVRGRIRRLQQDRLIAFTAITSFDLEKARLAFVGVQADVDQISRIAREIADLPTVNCVLVTLGRFNVVAISVFRELDELHELASERILAIEGVHHVETSISVKAVKYDVRIARITEADPSLDVVEGGENA
jgi:DNA-binding Lrp family transcriptional regulator